MSAYLKFEQTRLIKLTPGRLGLLRRQDTIQRDRVRDFERDIRSQETNYDQCSDLPGTYRRDLEKHQPRPTTIGANLWDARVSKA